MKRHLRNLFYALSPRHWGTSYIEGRTKQHQIIRLVLWRPLHLNIFWCPLKWLLYADIWLIAYTQLCWILSIFPYIFFYLLFSSFSVGYFFYVLLSYSVWEIFLASNQKLTKCWSNLITHRPTDTHRLCFHAVCTKQVLLTSEDRLCCSVEPQENSFGAWWLAVSLLCLLVLFYFCCMLQLRDWVLPFVVLILERAAII